MHAIRIHAFGGPDVLRLEEVPDPKPAKGEVLVRAKAIGVNPVDTYIRAGIYGERPFPFTPGMDASGLVETIGPGVHAVKPNDRVYIHGSISGTYAEMILCKETQVHPLPKRVTFSQGAAVGVPYATAAFALTNRAQAQANETVLIHGASGGVGVAAVQLATALKLKVIGTAGTDKGRTLVKKQGAQYVLDHHSSGYLEEIMKITGGKGVNIILEMLANVNLGNDLKVLSAHGRVIVIGSRGPVEINPRDTMVRHTDIRGMSMMTVSDPALEVIHATLVKGLTQGTLEPVIGKEISLSEAGQAHEDVLAPGAHGKIVLLP